MLDPTVTKSPDLVRSVPDDRAAPDVIIACVCGGRAWYAIPDGFNSFLLECPACGHRADVAGGPERLLTLKEIPDDPPSDVERTIEEAERRS